MGSALWIAISGLNASSREIDVIANNIANANTMGFKAGKAEFENILGQTLAGGASGVMQIGQGVGIADITTQFAQGSMETSSSGLDLAIDGSGFFIVNGADGAQDYTRAGAFHIDANGYLVDANSYRVQGYGPGSAALGDINTQNAQSAPMATTSFSVGLNLDSQAQTGDTFNSSQTVYDSLGTAHSLNVTYTKSSTTGQWTISAGLDGVAATNQTSSALQFDSTGNLVTPLDNTITFAALSNGATIGTANAITWDMTSASAQKVTSYASASTVSALTDDGYPSGSLKSLSVEKDGTIMGSFSNGQTSSLGKIALAEFANTEGLNKIGQNLFSETLNSGQAIINTPGSGGLGEVKANYLEMSNTDIGTEFINMISAQRAYQANAKVITTTDDMMSALLNAKR